jgi:hypothetical protein
MQGEALDEILSSPLNLGLAADIALRLRIAIVHGYFWPGERMATSMRTVAPVALTTEADATAFVRSCVSWRCPPPRRRGVSVSPRTGESARRDRIDLP